MKFTSAIKWFLIGLLALTGFVASAQIPSTICYQGSQPGTLSCWANSTGAIPGHLVRVTSTGIQTLATTDSASTAIGMATGAGTSALTSQLVVVVQNGSYLGYTAVFDSGGATAGDWVSPSGITGGAFADTAIASSAARPAGAVGIVQATVSASASGPVLMTNLAQGAGKSSSCDMFFGDQSQSTSILGSTTLGPQPDTCLITDPQTVQEIEIIADQGTPSIIIGRDRLGTKVNLLSGALATGSAGALACSNTGGTTSLNGTTTCSGTLLNTGLNIGDYLYAVSGSPSTAKAVTVHIWKRVN